MIRNITRKKWVSFLLIFLTYSLMFPVHIFALPQGGKVVAGQASINQPDVNNMNIKQGSHRAVINWKGFSIEQPESVRFFQPSSSASALNRVTGGDPSRIYGNLSANGNIFVINPNGVLVGATGRVETNSFIASTLDMDNNDFMSGNYIFQQTLGSSLSSIVNQGTITAADNGYVSLLAPSVRNEGSIVANFGKVYIGSGEQVTLNFAANDLIGFAVEGDIQGQVLGPDGNLMESSISNTGLIKADGGEIILSAKNAYDAIKSVVNNEGIIEAQSLVNENGVIKLVGGGQGIVSNSGMLDASGKDTGETGGMVMVLGEKVGLFDDSEIDVSGDEGGGTALVGGDFQGNNPDVQNAKRTYVGKDAVIKADAITKGDGGKVIVWADEITRHYGSISAIGGYLSGNGGFAEVSGKMSLLYRGDIDLSALAGDTGQLLLDPENIIIAGGTGSGIYDSELPTTAFDTHNGIDYTFSEETLEDSGAAVITLQAQNGISVSGTFDHIVDAEAVGTLLFADGTDIIMETRNAGGEGTAGIDLTGITVQTQGDGNISLTTGTDGGAGAANITVSTLMTGNTADSGSITLDSNGDIIVNTGGGISTGDLDYSPTGTDVRGNVQTGAITLTAAGNITLNNADVSTGDAKTYDDSGIANGIATSGSITGTAGNTITGSGKISTGYAWSTNTQGATDSEDDDVTSGSISLTATSGAITLSNPTTAVETGYAMRDVDTDTGADDVTSGSITLSASGNIDSDGAGGDLLMAIGDATTTDSSLDSGGTPITVTDGALTLTTSADASVASSSHIIIENGSNVTGNVSISSTSGITLGQTTGSTVLTAGGNVVLNADSDNDTAGDIMEVNGGDVEIDADGDVTLTAANIGDDSWTNAMRGTTEDGGNGIDISGDASGDSILTVVSTSDANNEDIEIDVATDQFNAISITLANSEPDVDIDLPGADVIDIDGGGGETDIMSVITTANGADFTFAQNEANENTRVEGDSVDVDGNVSISSTGTVRLGQAIVGTNVITATGDVTINGDSDSNGAGTINDDNNAQVEIYAEGNVTLIGTTMGGGNGIDIDAGAADHNSTLTVISTATGGNNIDVDVAADLFSSVSVNLAISDPDVDIDLSGGDTIDINGAGGQSTINSVTTTNNGADFTYELTESVEDVVITNINAGGEVDITGDGDISIATLDGNANDVYLTSVAGSLYDNTSDITAADLYLSAASSGAAIGATGTPLNTNLSGNLKPITMTGSGGVYISNTGGLVVESIDANTGNIELSDTSGAITDTAGDDTTTDISGADLTIVSAAGVGNTAADALNLNVTNLTVTASSADVFISDADGLGIGTINAGANDVNLRSLTGSLTDNTSAITAANLTLTVDAADQVIGATGAGALDTTISGGLTANAATGTGGVYVSNTGDLSVDSIDADTGNVELTSTGAILDAGDDALTDITANQAVLTAVTGVNAAGGNTSLETDVDDLDVTVSGTGAIDIAENDGVTLSDVDTADGAITITAGGAVIATDVEARDGNVSLTSDSGMTATLVTATDSGATGDYDVNLTNNSSGDVDVTTVTADHDVTMVSAGDITDNTSDITAGNDATLTAAGGIGTDSTINFSSIGNNLVLNTSGLNAAGDIDVGVTGAFNGSGITANTDAGTVQTVGITADSINLGAGGFNAGTDNLSLTANTGGIQSAGNISANDLTLTANTADQAIGATGAGAISTTLTGDLTASANNGTGGVYISDTAGLEVTSIDADTGNVELTAVGAITDTAGDDTTTDITGADLTIVSAAGVGNTAADALNLNVTNLTVTASSADVFISDADGLGIGTINAGANDVNLRSLTGSLTDNTSAITAADLTLTVDAVDQAIGATGAGALDTTISGGLTANAATGTGGVYVSNTGDLSVTSIDADTGNVELTSTGAILDAGDDALTDITANQAVLTAVTGVNAAGGNTSLETDVDDLDVTVSGTGAIDIAENDGVTLSDVDTADGAITITAGGAVIVTDVAAIDGTVSLTSDGGMTATLVTATDSAATGDHAVSLTNNSSGDVDVTTVTADHDVTIVSAGDITDNTSDITAGNDATLTAGGGIGTDSTINFSSIGNNLVLNTSGLNAAGDIDVGVTGAFNGSGITTNTDAGTVQTVGITADSINLGAGGFNAGTDNLSLTANTGGIQSAGNISANDLTLTANTADQAIGTTGAGAISTTLTGGLTASANNGTGGVYISDTAGLEVTSIDADTGNVELTAVGAITDTAGDDTTTDITGADLTIVSAAGVGNTAADALNLDITNLTVTASSADVFISDADGLGIGTINAGANDVNLRSLTGSLTDNTSAITAADLTLTVDAADQAIGATGAGALDTTISGGLAANAATGTGGVYISDTTGLEVTSIDAGTGNVELTAVGAITDTAGDDTTTDISGADLTIVSAAGVGNTAADALNLDITNLTVTASSSDVFISDADGLGIGTINAGANDVNLRSLTGSLTDNTSAITAADLTLTVDAADQAIGATGAGALDTTISGGLTANAATGTGGVYVSNTGDLSVDSIDADTGNVELTSTGAILDAGDDALTDIAANQAVLTAVTGVNAVGGNTSLETDVADLDVTVSGTGAIDIAENDLVTLSDVDTADGAITITAGGVVTATDVAAIDGTVSITSDGGMTATLVTASDSAATGDHAVSLTNNSSGDVDVTTVTADHDVTIVSAGDITDNTSDITAGNDATLTAGGGIGTDSTINFASIGNNLVLNTSGLNAAGDIDVGITGAYTGAGITANTDAGTAQTVGISADSITLGAGGLSGGTDNLSLTANTGNIQTSGTISGNDVTLVSTAADIIFSQGAGVTGVSAVGAANLSAASGAVQGNANVATDISGTSVTITANQGIGSTNAIETSTTSLTANNMGGGAANDVSITNDQALNLGGGGTVTNTGTGNITVAVTGGANDLTISDTVSGNADINLSSGRDIIFAQGAGVTGIDSLGAAGAVNLNATSGAVEGNANAATDIATTATGTITINANQGIGATNAIETSTSAITANNVGGGAAGDISITNDQSLNLGGGGTVTNAAAAGNISVAVTGGTSDLTVSNTVTGNADVALSSGRDIIFAQAVATTGVSAGGAVTLNAASGEIQGNANAATDVSGTSLDATGSSGIGNANTLETSVNTLTFNNTSNAVQVVDTGGITASGTNTSGAVTINEAGAMVIGAAGISGTTIDIDAGGNLTGSGVITASDGSATAMDINAAKIGAGGAAIGVALTGGGELTLTSTGNAAANSGDIYVTSDSNNIDLGVISVTDWANDTDVSITTTTSGNITFADVTTETSNIDVILNAAGSVTVSDTSGDAGIDLGAGSFDIDAGTDVTVSGRLTSNAVAGTSNFLDIDAGNDVNISGTVETVGGVGNFSGNDIRIGNSSGVGNDVSISGTVQTGDATGTGASASSGDVNVWNVGGDIIVSGSLSTGDATGSGASMQSGEVNMGYQCLGDLNLSGTISSGNAVCDALHASNTNLYTGNTYVYDLGGNVYGGGTVSTGNADSNGQTGVILSDSGDTYVGHPNLTFQIKGYIDDLTVQSGFASSNSHHATSGSVTLRADGSVGKTATQVTVASGNATVNNPAASEVATTGNISITASGIGDQAGGTAQNPNLPVSVTLGAPTGGITNTLGSLTATTTGAGAAGDVYLSFPSAGDLGTITTDAGSSQIISLTMAAGDMNLSAAANYGDDALYVTLNGGAFNMGTNNVTAAGGVGIQTTGNITGTGSITADGTAASANSAGNDAGAVTLYSTGGSINVGAISAVGSVGDDTAGTTAYDGGAGGAVTITADAGTVAVGTINTSGADAIGAGAEVVSGGNGGDINITSSGGALTLNGALTAAGGDDGGTTNGTSGANGDVTLTAAGTINDGGLITADLLTTSSDGGTMLTGFAHEVTSFNATDASGGTIILGDAGGVDITGVSNAGGNFGIASTGAITDSGAINANWIEFIADGGVTLDFGHTVNIFGTNNSGSGDVVLVDAGGVDIDHISNSVGNTTITTTGAISDSGSIDTQLLTTSSDGGTVLDENHTVTSFNATNTTGGNVILNDAGGVDITGISNAVGDTTITTTGAISDSGDIDTALLTTSSDGGTILDENHTVTSFNAANTTGGNVELNDAGGVDITGISNAVGNVILTNTGAISDSGAISAGTLTATSDGGAVFDFGHSVNYFGATNTTNGNVEINNTAVGMLFINDINNAVGNVTITSAEDIWDLGTITTDLLTTSSNGRTYLWDNTHVINSFNGTDTGAFYIALREIDGFDITGISNTGGGTNDFFITSTGGAITDSGAIVADTIEVQNSDGGVELDAGHTINSFYVGNNTGGGLVELVNTTDVNIVVVNNSSGDTTINASGAITDSGTISTNLLTTTSQGGTTLDVAHAITSFDGTNTVGGDIYVNDTGGIDIAGIDNTVGNATVITTGIISDSGAITTGQLTTSSANGTTLDAGLTITDLNATNTNVGDITVSNTGALNIVGISNAVGNANITATGAISDSGTIAAGTLSTSSDGGTILDVGHSVSTFNAANTTGGNVALTNTGTLDIAGINNTVGDITIANTGAIILSGASDSSTNTVNMDTGGTRTITGAGLITGDAINLQTVSGTGAIGTAVTSVNTAGTTTLNMGQGTTLTGAYINHTGDLNLNTASLAANSPLVIASSGSLTLPVGGSIDTGTADLSLTAGTAMTSDKVLSTTTGNITLVANGGELAVNNTVTAANGDVTLTAAGTITESAVITANLLTTSSDGGTDLSNSTHAVGAFDATNTTGGDVLLVDASGLNINSINNAPGNTNITTSGAITESGVITTGVLTTSSDGGTDLDNNTHAITGFNATNTTGGDVVLADAGGVDITGISNASGNTSITTSGAITESGVITTGLLTTTSDGGTDLDNNTHAITGFNATNTTGGNVVLDDAGGVNITGISNASGNTTITTSGAITENGVITTGLLTTSSDGGTNLTSNTHSITAFNATNTTSGTVVIFDAGGLDITGINNASGSTGIGTSGVLTESGVITTNILAVISDGGADLDNNTHAVTDFNAVNSTGGNVVLADAGGVNIIGIDNAPGNTSITTSGAITESGVIDTGLLTTSSDGGTDLNNNTHTITGFNATNTTSGDVVLADAGGVDITGISNAPGNTSISTTGALTESGVITTGILTTSSQGGTDFDNNTHAVTSFDATNTGGGDVVLDDAGGVDIVGISNATGNAGITTSGAISDSGAIAAGTLTTSSDGGTLLDVGHTVSAFNATNTSSGDVALTNTGSLDVTGINNTVGSIALVNTGAITLNGASNAGTNTVNMDTGGAGTITGAGLITGDNINLQTMSGTGAIGTAATFVNTAGTTVLTMGQANTLDGVHVNHTGNLTLNSASIAPNSPLEVVSSGTISIPATTINTGTADLRIESGSSFSTLADLGTTSGDITLAANGGALTINNAVTSSAGGDIGLTSTGGTLDINADVTATGGDVTLTANTGAITDSSSSPSAQITANLLTANATGGIDLDFGHNVSQFSATNVGGGLIDFNNTGGGFTVAAGGIDNGISDVTLTSTGQILDNGAITAGLLTTSSDGGTILDFGHDIFDLDATNTTGGGIAINDTVGGLNIRGLTSDSGNVLLSTNGLMTTGAFGVVNVNGGGNTFLSAGAGNDIILNNNNTFSGSVNIVSGQNVELSTSPALTIDMAGAVISGDLTIVAGDNITQSGSLLVAGTTTLSANFPNQIVLTNPGNDFSTVVVSTTATGFSDIALRDANDVVVDASDVDGSVQITAGGDISTIGALDVTGVVALNSQGGSVTLNEAVTANGGFYSAGTTFDNTGGGTIDTSLNNSNIILNHTGVVTIANDFTSGDGNITVGTKADIGLWADLTSNAGEITIAAQNSAIEGTGTFSGIHGKVFAGTVGLSDVYANAPTANVETLDVTLTGLGPKPPLELIPGPWSGQMQNGDRLGLGGLLPPPPATNPQVANATTYTSITGKFRIGNVVFGPGGVGAIIIPIEDIFSDVAGVVAGATVFSPMDEALEEQLKASSKSEFFSKKPVDINIDVQECDELDEKGECIEKEEDCERDEYGDCIDEEYGLLNDGVIDKSDRIAAFSSKESSQ